MTELFDTHFHCSPEDDLSALLVRARLAGVDWLTIVATDLSSSRQLLDRLEVEADSRLLAAVGVHPHQAAEFNHGDLAQLRELAGRQPPVRAIGEIGLDYHYEFSPRARQQEVFGSLLILAAELAMPVIVHCREAHQDCFRIIRETGVAERSRILLHSYTGEIEWVRRFSRELDCWFSFNGIVTFKQADKVRESLLAVPANRLLLETDAPYLAPVPYRGRPNQPAWLREIAKSVSALKKLALDDLASLTTANARRFFGVDN